MERSLSILLPAHNAQASLRANVTKVLDVAAELTGKLELLIIDDGSTDHTVEVALELATCYPQVKVASLPRRSGLAEAVRVGLERTTGEIVCVHEGPGQIDLADLRQLWQLRDDQDLVLARHGARTDAAHDGWVSRLLGGAREATPPADGGFHLLRRDAFTALQGGEPLAASQHEIRLRRDNGRTAQPATAPRRPNFLDKIRHLALGE